jgi:mono/diheme cytochrome c family protein
MSESVRKRIRVAGAGVLLAGVVALPSGSRVVLAGAPAQAGWSAEATYLDKCAVCHGKDGAGKTAKGRKSKVKDVRETIGKMSEADMIKIVNEGKAPNMDAFNKDFTADQIKALVVYYRGLAK